MISQRESPLLRGRGWFLLLGMWFGYTLLKQMCQRSLFKVCNLCECGFKISSTKSAAVPFTRKHDSVPISLILRDSTRLQMKNQYKYLGLTFPRKGSYSKHVRSVAPKCRSHLNVIRMLKGMSWGAGKRSLLTVYMSLVRSVKVYGMEAYFFTSPSLLKPLHKIQNDALRLCTGAMASTPLICLHHACEEMPLLIRHKFFCLKFKAHLLTSSDHPAQSLIEDCWQERFPDSPSFCSFNMFTKVAVDHSTFASAPLRIPNIPPWSLQKPTVDLTLLQFVHQTTLRSLHFFSGRIYTIYMTIVLLYTDGSKTSTRAGCSIYTEEKK